MPQTHPSRRQILLSAGLALTAALPLSACTTTPNQEQPASTPASQEPITLRFANAAPAGSLDTGISASLETRRISAQILDTLVSPHPDTGAPTPGLASSWETSPDGLTITLTLQDNLRFSDGSPLTGQSILENFKRWQVLAQQTHRAASYPYRMLLAPYTSQGSKPLVSKLTATDTSLTFTLTRPSVAFLPMLTHPAFGIAKPGTWNEEGHLTGLPLGSGAFTCTSWENETATLTANPHYWGKAPTISRIIFTSIPLAERRYYELKQGRIDCYDQVDRDSFVPLAKEGIITQIRDPFASIYLDLNLSHPVLNNIYIRRAISHAINRNELTDKLFHKGSYPISSYIPHALQIEEKSLQPYFRTNTDLAKELLARSGYQQEPIDFYYPTGVQLSALPNPEALYANLAASLTGIGLTIRPVPIPYQDGYLDKISAPSTDRGISLVAHFGSYRDPLAFLEPILGKLPQDLLNSTLPTTELHAPSLPKPSTSATPTASPSPETPKVTIPELDATPPAADAPKKLLQALQKADQPAETEAYRQRYIALLESWAELLPAVPLLYSASSLAQGKEVTSLPISVTGVSQLARARKA